MKAKIKIVNHPKYGKAMADRTKKIAADCATCFDNIQNSANDVIKKIDEDFQTQRHKMSEEWTNFLSEANRTLENSILHSEKESGRVVSNSKWILTIVLGITFTLGAVTGYTWNQLPTKADRQDVLTKSETKMILDLTRAYNADQYIHNPNAKTDSTNYDWLVKKIFSGEMRGTKY